VATLAVVLFVVVAVALILLRQPVALAQGAVLGGRLGAGCVIAQAVLLLVAAGVLFLLRDQL